MSLGTSIIVTFKVCLICTLMFMGLKNYHALNEKVTAVTLMFIYYIVLMLILLTYELFWEHIGLLFITLVLGQIGQLI